MSEIAKLGENLAPLLPTMRSRHPKIEHVSQILLTLHKLDDKPPFETARSKILEYAARRAGGKLPEDALKGNSFITDEVGARRLEGVSIENPRYWALRFDDDDRDVARRSWVIETALAEQDDGKPTFFGLRLQCIARGENPPYDRTVPTFARDVLGVCDARLDNRRLCPTPWFIDTEEGVDNLISLLSSPDRAADVVVISLPERTNDISDAIISSEKMVNDLAGAAHVAVITGQSTFSLSDRVGREFSVFDRAVRTYRPGFDPDAEDPFVHPLGLPDRIQNWSGGPDAFQRFITSEILRRTVEGSDALKKLPTLGEAKRTAVELRRQDIRQTGASDDELLALAEDEIKQLKQDLKSQKEESEGLLAVAESERDQADEQLLKLKGTLHHLQQRVESIESADQKAATPIPEILNNLGAWAKKHLAGSVEIHNRALRAAKASQYVDVSFIYRVLLLLRDYYVPMRRDGGTDRKTAFEQQCQKLGIEEQPTFAGDRAGEQGETYFVRIGNQRIELDRHLKKGANREPKHCFRLYFFWDDSTSQVIVGSLPSHLPTRAS